MLEQTFNLLESAEHGGHGAFSKHRQTHALCGHQAEHWFEAVSDIASQPLARPAHEVPALEVADRRCRGLDLEGDIYSGAESVHLCRLCGPVRMMQRQYLGPVAPDHASHRSCDWLQTTGFSDGDASSCKLVTGRLESSPLGDVRHDCCIAKRPDESLQARQRVVSTDAIAAQIHVQLEVRDGRGRQRAPDAIDATHGKPQRAEHALHIGDVVTAQLRRPQIQQPIAQPLSSLNQQRPGLGTADAVDVDGTLLLERLDGFGSCRVVRSGDGAGPVARRAQAVLQVSNVRTSGTDAERSDQRNSPISSSSALFGLAPTSRFAGSPSRNMINVGMLMT